MFLSFYPFLPFTMANLRFNSVVNTKLTFQCCQVSKAIKWFCCTWRCYIKWRTEDLFPQRKGTYAYTLKGMYNIVI